MTQARWFVRSVAVLVGLANLVVLAHFFGGIPALPTGIAWRNVAVGQAFPYVLAAVIAGLLTAEVALRRFDRLSALGGYVFMDRLFYLRAGVVGALCLGGVLMGILLGALLALQVPTGSTGGTPGPAVSVAVTLVRCIGTGFFGAIFGAAAGASEGLLLAPPLAAVLRRSGGEGRPAGTTA